MTYHSLFALLLAVASCGDAMSDPTPDASVTQDAPDEPSCAVLGCTVPMCTNDGCTCHGTPCVPTGIPRPSCADLMCISIACGMGPEAGLCTCEVAPMTYETCAVTP